MEKNYNDIDVLKKFLLGLYFPKHWIQENSNISIRLTFRDKILLKASFLPKRLYRRYYLTLLDKKKNEIAKTKIPFKDKESVKYFVEIIAKNSKDNSKVKLMELTTPQSENNIKTIKHARSNSF